jgi:hypothetical protein
MAFPQSFFFRNSMMERVPAAGSFLGAVLGGCVLSFVKRRENGFHAQWKPNESFLCVKGEGNDLLFFLLRDFRLLSNLCLLSNLFLHFFFFDLNGKEEDTLRSDMLCAVCVQFLPYRQQGNRGQQGSVHSRALDESLLHFPTGSVTVQEHREM